MTEALERIREDYERALAEYLERGGESALLKAYEAGRAAVSEHLGLLEMSAIHQTAVVQVLLQRLPAEERERVARLAAEFSAESLVPFEITVRGAREANTMLRQLNVTLAGKNDEIREQLAELRQLQSLKDDLISLVVHDLRNPLTGMLSCLELIESSSDDGMREIVRLAREGGRKIAELVDDLLEVRKLEEGRLELRREPHHVLEIVKGAVSTFRGTAKLEGIALAVEDGSLDRVVTVDRRLVQRSVENLISNALKFTPPGQGIAVAVIESDGKSVIEVRDRGPGLPNELRDRLFQKFASVEGKERGTRRGYGLGLYVVKLVATAHGGTVEARDREGGGTVFRFVLP